MAATPSLVDTLVQSGYFRSVEKTKLVVRGRKDAYFMCPACPSRRVALPVSFPKAWQFRTCKGCGTTWTNLDFYREQDLTNDTDMLGEHEIEVCV